jgi:hypothetical protein
MASWPFIWLLGDLHYIMKNNIQMWIYLINPYIAQFLWIMVVVVIFNGSELYWGYWKRSNYGFKYFVLNSVYILTIIVSSVLIGLFNVEFIGDGCGSFGMAYLPSILLYTLIGIPFTLFFHYRAKKNPFRYR